MINPYAGVDWAAAVTVPSITHAHCRSLTRLNRLVNRCVPGLGAKMHLNVSNYWPSFPLFPLRDGKSYPYSERLTWCYNGGTAEEKAARAEALAADPDNYVPETLTEFIETVGAREDIVPSPNSEHSRIEINGFGPEAYNKWHMCSVGSTYWDGCSERNRPAEGRGGTEKDWKLFLDEVFEELVYPDGGGVTINHPTWTGAHLTFKMILDALDYDQRVLGIEVMVNGRDDRGLWDKILLTGRRCWGFGSPDHAHETEEQKNTWPGVNVLLTDPEEDEEHECLRAYRDGRFYVKADPGTELMFTGISFADGVISCSAQNAERIVLVVDGDRETHEGSALEKDIGTNHVYVRVEAWGEDPGDWIASNPIMLDGRPRRRGRYRKYGTTL